ncbi:hypothetical protein DFP72DRAFT_402970 [Ephemerocybe angulata]|uniref:Uncharacterized protein n=1 Tax=Ephemerocybe angulata TaxID=980116 RepID=A0A8H6HWR9_9AGAR|nr:hypothetical protein DFP72DRAFT_402970 [Tulosesus angulatus]
MELSLPLELIHTLIEASRDDLTTLLQFSLVSRQCLAESRRYAFERVQLGRDSTWPLTVSQGPMNGSSERLLMESSRIEEFHALLLANTTLGTYVCDLDIGVGSFLPPRERPHAASESQGSGTGGVLAYDLPAILDLLPALTSLGVTSNKLCCWTALPPQLQGAIERCCARHRIKKLEFAKFYDFPYTLVTAPPNLEELYLSYVFEPAAKGHLRSRPAVVRQPRRLKTVSVVDYGSPVVGELLQEDPEAFSEVETIIWHLHQSWTVHVQ